MGVLLLTGLFKPYSSFPVADDIKLIQAEIRVLNKGENSNFLTVRVREVDYILCNKIWVPMEEIIDDFDADESKRSMIGVDKKFMDSKDRELSCLKVYSLSIEGDDLLVFDDAKNSRNYITMFFRIIGLILFVFGTYDLIKKNQYNGKKHR